VLTAAEFPSRGGATRMSRALVFLNSSVGKKIVMAVTGIILSLFILGHVSGNLLVFKGA